MGYNQELKDLYKGAITEYIKAAKENKLSDELNKLSLPLLLSVDEEKHSKAKLRVMIFGQETRSWGSRTVRSMSAELDLDLALNVYDGFYIYNDGNSDGYRTIDSPFNQLNKKLRDTYNSKNVSFVTNNLYKFGKVEGSGHVEDKFIDHERAYFNVIGKELEILKIDLVLFLTGPRYDWQLKQVLKDAEFSEFEKGVSPRQASKVTIGKLNGLRLYHPAYMRRKGLEKKYFHEISNLIEAALKSK